jgi:hypothetical protein
MKNHMTARRRGRGRWRLIGLTALGAAALTTLVVPLGSSARAQVAPSNTSPPTVTGSATNGETLVAGTGSWEGTAPISFSFQWSRCNSAGAECSPISSATNTTYVVADADVGARIRVLVTASNSDGSASALSDATPVVTDSSTPRNTAQPQITGSAVVGQRLTASTGTWTGAAPIAFAFQWVRCGADGGAPDGSNCALITGATANSYVLTQSDAGARMRVRVTATNAAGSATAASNATGTVGPGRAPVNTRRPSVTGSWVEGATATLNRGAWTGAASYAQQWLRCNSAGGDCTRISGATGTQYRLTAGDVGRKLRVDVTARNSAGSTTVRSSESAIVQPLGPAGIMTLPSGERSIPATSVPRGERLIVDRVVFTPTPIRSRTAPFDVRIRVKDTRGYVVRDALVFVRPTPLVAKAGQSRRTTVTDGWATFQMFPRASFPATRRTAVQFFVKAYRAGDNPLAGVAGYRLVQVRVSR